MSSNRSVLVDIILCPKKYGAKIYDPIVNAVTKIGKKFNGCSNGEFLDKSKTIVVSSKDAMNS